MPKRKIKTADEVREFFVIDLPSGELKKEPEIKKAPVERARKKIKSVSASEEKKINQDLKDIYVNADGSMPDMADFKKIKTSRWWRALGFLLFACLFLGVVAWAGLFFFPDKNKFSQEEVGLTVSGPEAVMAGETVQYRLFYRNNQNVPLAKAVLQARFPAGFVMTDSSVVPTNEKKDEWELGTLPGLATGYIDVAGKMYGNQNEEQSWRVFLNYTPANFSAEFQKVASLKVKVDKSPIELTVLAPTEISLGTGVELAVDIKQVSDKADLVNLAILLEAPDFTKTSSTIASDQKNNNLWHLTDIEDGQLIIKGVFSSAENKDKTMVVFKVVGWKDEKQQDEPMAFAVYNNEIQLSKTDIGVELAVNGTTGDLSVEPDETLSFSVNVKNSGEQTIKKLSARLILEAPSYNNKSILDWQKITDSADGDISGEQLNPQTRRGIISWTGNKVSALREIKSGKEATWDLHLPVRNEQQLDLTQFTSFKGSAVVEVKYDNGDGEKVLQSNLINLLFNSDLQMEVRDQVSTGSSGLETHKITWLISNSFHELKDLELSADLYGDIAWQADSLVVPAGEAKFDATTKKITWQIKAMPTSVDVLALQFAVVLNKKNPSQTNLTSKVNLKAVDVITGAVIVKAGNEILLQ